MHKVTFEFKEAEYKYLMEVAADYDPNPEKHGEPNLGKVIGNSLSIQKALRSTEEGEALVYDRKSGKAKIRKFA